MKEVLHKTREEWEEFSLEQKTGATIANTLTAIRPIMAVGVAAKGLDTQREWTKEDAMMMSGAYLTDMEGSIARAFDAKTTLGGALDPMADKIASAAPEIILAIRGEEDPTNVAVKIGRDVAISALRSYVVKKSEGEISISAGWSGKANTAFRQAVNVFAMSPLGERYPKTRRTLQTASAIGTVASGLHTGYKLWRALKDHEAKKASRE